MLRWVLPLLIFCFGLASAWWLMYSSQSVTTQSQTTTVTSSPSSSGSAQKSNDLSASNSKALRAELPMVQTLVIKPEIWSLPIHTSGLVQSERQVQLIAEVDGRLVKVHPNIAAGLPVAQGEVLYTIESLPLQAQLVAAQTKLHQAQLELQRTQAQLNAAGEVPGLKTPQAYRESLLQAQQAIVKAASAELSLAQKRYNSQSIMAPFSGRVVDKGIAVGQSVPMGAELATTYVPDDLAVAISLNQADSQRLRAIDSADAVSVVIAQSSGADFQYYSGNLQTLQGELDPATGLEQLRVQVQLSDNNYELRAGTRVDVRLSVPSSQPLLRVPLSVARQGSIFSLVDVKNGLVHDATGEVQRLTLERVYRDRQYAYYQPPHPNKVLLVDRPPSWLVPGYKVRFKAPSLDMGETQQIGSWFPGEQGA